MTTQNIALFKALGAKMNFLDERQRILAQNVANADTPDYRPQDLVPVDFGQVLKETSGDNVVRPALTSPMHMARGGSIADPKQTREKKPYEIAPAGNAVILEEQMVNASKTMMDYNLMTSLYQKNVNMIRTAIGK